MAKKTATTKEAPKKPAVPDLFNKAKTLAGESKQDTAKSKGTIFRLPEHLPGLTTEAEKVALDRLHGAVHDVINESQKKKAAEGACNLAKGQLNPVVLEMVTKKWVELGTSPATPVSILNRTGEGLTFVMQNKTDQNPWSDQQHDELVELVGADAVEEDWEEKITVFSLNPNVISQEGVADKLNAAIHAAGLTKEQAEMLLVCDVQTKIKKTVPARLVELVGKDVGRLLRAMEILGSQFVRYLQA